MHQLIYALVQASTDEHALRNAQATFDRLVGASLHETLVFDYYVTFDDHQSSTAGPARWGDLPVAARAHSPAGAELIERGWNHMHKQFDRNLTAVQDALTQYSADEIMADTDLVRHSFYNIGRYHGPTVTLYDENACGIRHRRGLDHVLDQDDIWVVPADVHY
ncbi:hypothetical protein [Haloarchaeobius sp. DFWS5]|uniref:hypothetical protein n=1 Tax=Haloarchaeobius sp. DFWS5 TaxID=3446114 RepID=UPI003EC08643